MKPGHDAFSTWVVGVVAVPCLVFCACCNPVTRKLCRPAPPPPTPGALAALLMADDFLTTAPNITNHTVGTDEHWQTEDNSMITEIAVTTDGTNAVPQPQTGWICPVCQRGVSPATTVCPCRQAAPVPDLQPPNSIPPTLRLEQSPFYPLPTGPPGWYHPNSSYAPPATCIPLARD